jgi:hypothetical protein
MMKSDVRNATDQIVSLLGDGVLRSLGRRLRIASGERGSFSISGHLVPFSAMAQERRADSKTQHGLVLARGVSLGDESRGQMIG